MEGQLREALTFPAENYTGSFFKRLPSDSRFLQNSYTKFGPAGSIQDKTIEFCLDRYDAANIYLIQFATLKVQCVIVKENGSLPSTDALVAPVNNVVHSLFESVRLIINDKPLTSSAGNYPYKAYITNCLTYSTVVKYSQLKCEGYYEDTSKIMGPSENNVGFIERNNLFRKKFEAGEDYRPEGATFYGRLLTDLVSCESGLPPNCKIKIELDRRPDEFVLMVKDGDNEKYHIKLTNICLLVPVAQLSQPVFQQLSTVQTKEDVAIHFRRLEVRPFNVPRNSEECNIENLFSDETPCRIAICFIETNHKNGSYHSNPFNLARAWKVPKDTVDSNPDRVEKERLESRLKLLEERLLSFMKKGKGRGKKTKETSEPQQSTSRGRPSDVDSDLWTDDLDTEDELFHIQKMELTINGTPIDQVICYHPQRIFCNGLE